MRRICLLGASGSIGASTLDLIARHRDTMQLRCAVARSDDARMEIICREHRPQWVVMVDPAAAERLRQRLADLQPVIDIQSGQAAVVAAAAESGSDTVVAAIVGAAGLEATLAAARAGKRLLLANKEALVCAGELFMAAVRHSGALLLPIDSEHNAIFQCLPGPGSGGPRRGVRRIWLTASGGPFRGLRAEQLAHVTPAQACAHPNWSMGPKISVDSATLMNKGLEVIEAQMLFGAALELALEDIRVLLHPQSTVHSLVEYVDGSFLAQLGSADMRIPIAHALAWPERIESGAATLDLSALARLDFGEPDLAAFPCLDLAYQAARAGGSAPTVLNAANEEAVTAFLNGSLGFLDIAHTVNAALNGCALSSVATLEAVHAADAEGRRLALAAMKRLDRS